MIKFGKILLLGLFSCLFTQAHAVTVQELKESSLLDAVRESDRYKLEFWLKFNKITSQKAKDLLEIAKEIEAKKKALSNISPRKEKIKSLKKFRLLFVKGAALGIGIYTWLDADDFLRNSGRNERMPKVSTLISGSITLLLSAYAFYLHKKIDKFNKAQYYFEPILCQWIRIKSKQEQYHDSVTVRQILERLAMEQ